MIKLKKNVLAPMMRRIGHTVAGAIISVLAITDPELVQAVQLVCGAVVMVVTDLYFSWKDRN